VTVTATAAAAVAVATIAGNRTSKYGHAIGRSLLLLKYGDAI
jgi:hypothetical protein